LAPTITDSARRKVSGKITYDFIIFHAAANGCCRRLTISIKRSQQRVRRSSLQILKGPSRATQPARPGCGAQRPMAQTGKNPPAAPTVSLPPASSPCNSTSNPEEGDEAPARPLAPVLRWGGPRRPAYTSPKWRDRITALAAPAARSLRGGRRTVAGADGGHPAGRTERGVPRRAIAVGEGRGERRELVQGERRDLLSVVPGAMMPTTAARKSGTPASSVLCTSVAPPGKRPASRSSVTVPGYIEYTWRFPAADTL
jgi:hypothetical protein